jgi:hypothetical protein
LCCLSFPLFSSLIISLFFSSLLFPLLFIYSFLNLLVPYLLFLYFFVPFLLASYMYPSSRANSPFLLISSICFILSFTFI